MKVAWEATAGIVEVADAGVAQKASVEIVALAAMQVWQHAVDNLHA